MRAGENFGQTAGDQTPHQTIIWATCPERGEEKRGSRRLIQAPLKLPRIMHEPLDSTAGRLTSTSVLSALTLN